MLAASNVRPITKLSTAALLIIAPLWVALQPAWSVVSTAVPTSAYDGGFHFWFLGDFAQPKAQLAAALITRLRYLWPPYALCPVDKGLYPWPHHPHHFLTNSFAEEVLILQWFSDDDGTLICKLDELLSTHLGTRSVHNIIAKVSDL